MFLLAHHVWLCPAWMYGAPELPCIVNSIRVTPPVTQLCWLHIWVPPPPELRPIGQRKSRSQCIICCSFETSKGCRTLCKRVLESRFTLDDCWSVARLYSDAAACPPDHRRFHSCHLVHAQARWDNSNRSRTNLCVVLMYCPGRGREVLWPSNPGEISLGFLVFAQTITHSNVP